MTVRNNHAPLKSAYQYAVVLQQGRQITVNRQTRDESQQTLRVDDGSAPSVDATAMLSATRAPMLGAMPEQERAVLDALAEPSQSPAVVLVALLLSADSTG